VEVEKALLLIGNSLKVRKKQLSNDEWRMRKSYFWLETL